MNQRQQPDDPRNRGYVEPGTPHQDQAVGSRHGPETVDRIAGELSGELDAVAPYELVEAIDPVVVPTA